MTYLCGGVPVDLRTRLGRIKLLPRRFANRFNAWHDYVTDRRRSQNGANYKSVTGSAGLTVFVEKARKQTLYLVDIFVITNPLKIVNFFISTLQILRDLLRQNNERRVAVIFGMLA